MCIGFHSFGQTDLDKTDVKKAGMNYLEGFYEGDTLKLKQALAPALHKFGFWKSEKTGTYGKASYMTYKGAIAYAAGVLKKKNFAKADAPKNVEVLEVMEYIAIAKITAWWGYDYVLLSKQSGKWLIEQVIWQGPYTAK